MEWLNSTPSLTWLQLILISFIGNLCGSILCTYIDRYEAKVVYYNKDKEFGSLYLEDDDPLFFRQSDYIYDEVVEKYDVVEYSLMKTYDFKKQKPSSKAILLKTLYEDIQY